MMKSWSAECFNIVQAYNMQQKKIILQRFQLIWFIQHGYFCFLYIKQKPITYQLTCQNVRRNINTEIRCSLLLFSKMFNVDEWRGCVCCFCTTLYSQIFVFTTEFLGFSPCYFYLCFVYLLCVSSLFVWTQTQRIFWSNVDLPQFFDIFLSYIWIMYTLRKDWVQQERKGEN